MYPTNRSAWNQVNRDIKVNTATLREGMEKEWQVLPQLTGQNKSCTSVTRNQAAQTVPPLDLRAIKASQQSIAPSLNQTQMQTSNTQKTSSNTTGHWRKASTPISASSSPSHFATYSNSKRHKRAESDKSGTKTRIEGSSSGTPSDTVSRARTQSVRGNESHSASSKLISPKAQRKEPMSSSSQSSSSATTPRNGSSATSPRNGSSATSPRDGESGIIKSPSSPRGASLRKSKGKITKALNDIDISKIAKQVKEALSPNSSPRKSPKESENADPLTSVSFAERNQLAKKILGIQMTEEFRRKTPLHQTALMHAIVSENLTVDSPLYNPDGLNLLIADAKRRCSNSSVDAVVNLTDVGFIDFVTGAIDGAFIKTWKKDASDLGDSELRKYLSTVKPTFVRDFSNSTYQVRGADGSLTKLNTIEEFIAYVEGDTKSGLAMVVSNIASQNMGNFLKNVMFLRQDANKVSQSYLRLFDGTPILPQAKVKASYVLSKGLDGALILDYTWESSKEINGNKEIRAKEVSERGASFAMEDPSLTITARVRIESAAKWEIENPHIKAAGWNQTPDH